MDIYLTILVSQIASSYAGKGNVKTIVDARGVIPDLSQAIPVNLIFNELITNLLVRFPVIVLLPACTGRTLHDPGHDQLTGRVIHSFRF